MTETVQSEGRTPGAAAFTKRPDESWNDYMARDPRQQQLDAMAVRQGHADHARDLLGWRAVLDAHGFAHWDRIAAEQVDGLPPASVEPARRAARVEYEAGQAMHDAARKADEWRAKYRPADGRTHPLLSAAHAEARTAYEEAQAVALRALAELGRVAADLAAIRAELAAIPGRIKTRRAECAQAEAADLRTETELRARLASYRLTN